MARQFSATFTHAEIERFPPHCRPGALVTLEEVAELAKCLSFSPIDGDAATVRLLTRMGHFFSAAAVRLSEIARMSREREKAPGA